MTTNRLKAKSSKTGAKNVLFLSQKEAEILNTLLSKASIGFALIDVKRRFLKVNGVMAEIYGMPAGEIIGKPADKLLLDIASVSSQIVDQVIKTGKPVLDFEMTGKTRAAPSTKRHWLKSYYPVYGKNKKLLGVGIVAIEITRRKQAEEQMHHQAFHDPLTNLPNRKHFDDHFYKVFRKAKRSGKKIAICFIDIDRLKDINDTLGHQVGDVVLKEVGSRLLRQEHENEFLARWGGDEFIVLKDGIGSAFDMVQSVKDYFAALDPVIKIDDNVFRVTASAGIAVFPNDGKDIRTLLKSADMALYGAKEMGRNRYELFGQNMSAGALSRRNLQNDIKSALLRDEFEVFFQPIINAKTGNFVSIEALLRWRHPRLGILLPEDFVPIAEDVGLIVPLGRKALKKSCAFLRTLHRQGMFLNLAVNVSARQFINDDIAGDIISILAEENIDPKYFELEITESSAMENSKQVKEALLNLRDRGISIIMDDFGMGFSSLNYLKQFPIQKLKIDKSFVQQSLAGKRDKNIIKAIISIAENLKLKVIAEGVDTKTQMDLLSSLGCHEMQGYSISKPLSANELKNFLQTRTVKNRNR